MKHAETKREVGIGLVGSGFMGRCQANAFTSVATLFETPVLPVKAVLADAEEEIAERNARALGFKRATADWKTLVEDSSVQIVAIAAPNALHEPVALAAIAAGKTVYCEKPLSITVPSAFRMTEAAEAKGVVTSVGFNFLRNPVIRLAKEILQCGKIGRITGFRGRHAENYMASGEVPHSFRTDPSGGGALADIGSHIVSLARYLLGPVREVIGDCATVFPTRPVAPNADARRDVAVDDMTHALLRFESGVSGSMEANWAATGRTMDLSFEISGENGAVFFSQERMNELRIYRRQAAGAGFTKIEAGPDHPPYGRFCPAPGHHLGFNDLKVIEVAELLEAHAADTRCFPDFREALEVQRTIDAIDRSYRTGVWTKVESE